MATEQDPSSIPFLPTVRSRQRGMAGEERNFLRHLGVLEGENQARPLVRDDLLRLMEENRGSAGYLSLRGLDMSQIDIRGLDLRKTFLSACDLEEAIAMPLVTMDDGTPLSIGDMAYETALNGWRTGETPDWVKSVKPTILSGALLNFANLSYGDFRWAKLDGAGMTRCNLTGADLSRADLSGASLNDTLIIDADLSSANLQDADIIGASISSRTRLENIGWGKKNINKFEREGKYPEAIAQYSQLVKWYEQMGFDEMAGHFNYRGRECQRKAEWKSLTNDFKRGWEKIRRKKKPQ